MAQALPCARKTGVDLSQGRRRDAAEVRGSTTGHLASPKRRRERDRSGQREETIMTYRSLLAAIALTALSISGAGAQILDYSKYPNLKGQWLPIGGPGR